ncbi:Phenylalanyl-tRNA synthetase alpha chain [Emticicia oligotrophica DSM 17448]|uniref:Phenylalanine--tRNA ligase alpha subunit n=1 Tax=Emticicia oligotrophica (strain DSM 17448 / CIP 109782 / MTCC 6937 / GPTSA100-15) TaxID=929562 RepID=A0ABM5N478_EMTOG|nr:phenylalanine--tRNA ligase subunit alpha [Emticicia oligotrophica]AFK04189.1 Phenylalanyl-tRNA synthetase alpha chain [Emticicia oligotrophica DSM 17448]
MLDKIQDLLREVDAVVVNSKEDLEKFRLKFISRKGLLNELFDEFKTVPNEQKKAVGQELNKLKNLAEQKLRDFTEALEQSAGSADANKGLDLTLPVAPNFAGTVHPLTLTRQRILEIFARMGFNHEDGPEVETDWYNFTALNFAENHPAREMQDTFFVEKKDVQKDDVLLRTHTSNVQVRLMEHKKPPIRSVMLGRVYRNEAISARAHCQFHQIEGLYVDKNVSFKDLKDTLYHFAKEMFGQDTKIRLRPSYFPFTEPSAEIDISCFICKGSGCNICKHTGWVEIAGSGMVDPNVLENSGIDSEEYTGFAFGMGIERITMLRYGVRDLRLFFENDVRFLRQFEGA